MSRWGWGVGQGSEVRVTGIGHSDFVNNHAMKILVQAFWCILHVCISRGTAAPSPGEGTAQNPGSMTWGRTL